MTDRPLRFFTAVKALIRHEGRLLLLRESGQYADGTQQGFYDVPGGRIIPGERWDDALRREVHEESGLNIRIGRPVHVSDVRITRADEDWQIMRIFFDCAATDATVTLGPDHDDYQWVETDRLATYHLISELAGIITDYLKLQGTP